MLEMAPSLDIGISLFCAEDAAGSVWESEAGSQYNEDDHMENVNQLHVSSSEDDEAIAMLVEKETCHMPEKDYAERYERLELDAASRKHAVDWILMVQSHYKLSPVTSYLSINYFDRFLSSHKMMQGKDWILQLLAVSCMCLAAKMEEADVLHPLDLQVGDLKYVFEARTIHRMELLILSTLKWRISSVTPFSYMGYLLHRIPILGPQLPSGLISRITDLILSTCRLMQFVCVRPSAIAAVSVMCACAEFFPLRAMNSYKAAIFSALPAVEEEALMKSYEVMQERLADPFWTSNAIATLSSAPSRSPAGVLDAAACLSSDDDSTIHDGHHFNTTRKRKLNADF